MNLRLIPLSLLLAGSALAAQEPSPQPTPEAGVPTFRTEVELVTVDVVVTDRKGNPISGLSSEDFTLSEDGKAQQITSFEAVELPPVPAPPPRTRISTNFRTRGQAWTGRSFAIVFDDIQLSPFEATKARTAVSQFLDRGVRAGDRVTLVAPAAGVWWTAEMPHGRDELVKLVEGLEGRRIPDRSRDRLTDYEAMQVYLYRDPLVINRIMRRWVTWGVLATDEGPRSLAGGSANPLSSDEDPLVHSKAAETYISATARNRVTLQVLERLLQALEGAKGRKAVILVSPGFIFDSSLDEFKGVVQASRRANAAIYTVDARGLTGLAGFGIEAGPAGLPEEDIGGTFAESFEATAGSEHVAVDSGGFVIKNTNALGKGIQRIADESSSYYLLGYYPTNTARDGDFRKIRVRVNRKNVRIRARKGYYATAEDAVPREVTPTGVDRRIQRAADAPFELEDVPIRVTSYVFEESLLGRARVLLVAEVDISDFAFQEREGRSVDTLDVVIVLNHRESGEVFQQDQRLDMNLLEETRRKYESSWFPIVQEFELATGGYQAKLIARDQNASRIGSVIHEFEVPSLSVFRTSTPILSDTLERSRDGNGVPSATMLARRSFGTGGMLFFQYEVFGAAPDPATGMPRVRAGYEIRRSDGTVQNSEEPSLIRHTSLGVLLRLSGATLRGAPPGDYELVLNVTDEVAGTGLERREPFTLIAPGGD